MTVSLESQIEKLTDAELERCFIETYEWRKVGVLPTDALTRKIWNDYKELSGQKTFAVHYVPEAIYYEIALRKYREDGIHL
jgi:hypothetical protein